VKERRQFGYGIFDGAMLDGFNDDCPDEDADCGGVFGNTSKDPGSPSRFPRYVQDLTAKLSETSRLLEMERVTHSVTADEARSLRNRLSMVQKTALMEMVERLVNEAGQDCAHPEGAAIACVWCDARATLAAAALGAAHEPEPKEGT
jgi:hypothetical protein